MRGNLHYIFDRIGQPRELGYHLYYDESYFHLIEYHVDHTNMGARLPDHFVADICMAEAERWIDSQANVIAWSLEYINCDKTYLIDVKLKGSDSLFKECKDRISALTYAIDHIVEANKKVENG